MQWESNISFSYIVLLIKQATLFFFWVGGSDATHQIYIYFINEKLAKYVMTISFLFFFLPQC